MKKLPLKRFTEKGFKLVDGDKYVLSEDAGAIEYKIAGGIDVQILKERSDVLITSVVWRSSMIPEGLADDVMCETNAVGTFWKPNLDKIATDAEQLLYCDGTCENTSGLLASKPIESVLPNKYDRSIRGKCGKTVTVDVYRVLDAFEVTNPQLQHLTKKALCAGLRGHKNTRQDLIDIRDSILNAIEMYDDQQP